MPSLVFPRVVSLSRSVHASDSTKGSRMVESQYATGLSASIQPKRDRNITPQNLPTAVSTTSADSMTTWKIILPRYTGTILHGDVATDERGIKYKIELVDPNAFGNYLEARVMLP